MKTNYLLGCAFILIAIIGCNQAETSTDKPNDSTPTGAQYLATTEPADSVPVGQARQEAKDGDAVVLLGHIGGKVKPFIEGIAAFTIVDPDVPYCDCEENCPTPWDYCCTQNEVKDNIATIKIVDEQGKVVGEDAKQLLGVKELALVIVQGTAQRDEQGNLSVLANKVFIKE